MHFLRLRLDPHAQYEIRVFAEAMARIVKDAVPIAYKAFEDYALNSLELSGLEKDFVASNKWPMKEETARKKFFTITDNNRETEEFITKLKALSLLS